MKKTFNFNLDQLFSLDNTLQILLRSNPPIKLSIIDAAKQINQKTRDFYYRREALIMEFCEKDEGGKPLIKEEAQEKPKDQISLEDIVYTDEKLFRRELNELINKEYKIKIKQVSPKRPVILNLKDKTHEKVTLEDYLEGAVDITPTVFTLIYQLFIKGEEPSKEEEGEQGEGEEQQSKLEVVQ